MLPFRRILVPVDYSEPCRAVAPYVRDMVRHYSASLTLIHAYPSVLFGYGDLAVDPILPEQIRLHEKERLQTFAVEMFHGQPTELVTAAGEPGTVLQNYVQHEGADLVMMGTHGYGPVRRLLLGSVTAKVLHDVNAVVWTAAGSAVGPAARMQYKAVLCALDESDEAEAVLSAAAAFAASWKARLSIVHVLDLPRVAVDFDFSQGEKELREQADFQMQELKSRLGIDAPHAVIDGTIAEGVQQEAVRRNADLIVTGRGLEQGAFSRLWSRLYPIIRESPCPVLSI